MLSPAARGFDTQLRSRVVGAGGAAKVRSPRLVSRTRHIPCQLEEDIIPEIASSTSNTRCTRWNNQRWQARGVFARDHPKNALPVTDNSDRNMDLSGVGARGNVENYVAGAIRGHIVGSGLAGAKIIAGERGGREDCWCPVAHVEIDSCERAVAVESELTNRSDR